MATAPLWRPAVLEPQRRFAERLLGEGLAEETLNALSQIDGLRVAARASSFSFKGRSSDLAEIGSKLKEEPCSTGACVGRATVYA